MRGVDHSNQRPDEEGITTPCSPPALAQFDIQTRDLMKKGYDGKVHGVSSRLRDSTRDLMKKGLRLVSKVMSPCWCIQTRDLIKKGLRLVDRLVLADRGVFKPETMKKKDYDAA